MATPDRPVRLDFSVSSRSADGNGILKWALPDLAQLSKSWHRDKPTPLIVTGVPRQPHADWFTSIITLPSWEDAFLYAFNIVPHRLASMGKHLGIAEGTWGVDVRLTDGVDEVPPSEVRIGFLTITLPTEVATRLMAKNPSGYHLEDDRAVVYYPLRGLGGEDWPTSPFGSDPLTEATERVVTETTAEPGPIDNARELPFGFTPEEATAYRLTIAKVPIAEIASRLGVSPSAAQGLVNAADRKLGNRSWDEVVSAMPELDGLARDGDPGPPGGGYPGVYRGTYGTGGVVQGADEDAIEGANPDETAYLNSEFGETLVRDTWAPKALVFFDAKTPTHDLGITVIYEIVSYIAHECGGRSVESSEPGLLAYAFGLVEEALDFALQFGPNATLDSSSNIEPDQIAAYFAVMPPEGRQPFGPNLVFGTVEIDLAPGFGLPADDPRMAYALQSPDQMSIRLDLRDKLRPLRWDIEQQDLPFIEEDASYDAYDEPEDDLSDERVVASILIDPDVVGAEDVVALVRAFSRAYEAIGGEPLEIRDGGTGVYEDARVPA